MEDGVFGGALRGGKKMFSLAKRVNNECQHTMKGLFVCYDK
jgi:hypothetical protein